ncbi:homeobox protein LUMINIDEPENDENS [Phragmites australis]|uniref:homeobox protein LUMINIDEPENDENS n=1 Tax=Phragmites australis TaxID=29695 RepID=UPI002D79C8A5|nr:homeobox protein LUMINIDEPENDENS [Phragmites australis]
MDLVPFKPAAGALVEASGWIDAGAIPAMVAAQQEMLHAQVNQLQRLVVAQCHLTGVNPLAQEMAAGALSIKIGKKPRDLLNPKSVKCMQSLFALKDTIGKRETREISALCGVTVTQVREFFASQRARVRKFVTLSREKALRIETPNAHGNVCSITTEQTPIDIEAHAEVVEPLRILEPVQIPQSSSQPSDVPQISLQPMEVPQSCLQPMDVLQNSLQQAEVQQNCSAPFMPSGTMVMQPTDAKINPDSVRKEPKQDEVVPGVDSEDKKFLDSIFALMWKEETFSGQVKLMEWILQVNNVTILSWFLTMGGLTIVSTWLSQAAIEEQTSVILVIFKVLLHLPLHKALPAHMSVVLQTINRLRFYRTQDISSRARNLLSRLSKVLVRSHALKKPQKELIRKQRISEILRDESWKSEVDITEEIIALTDGANENRKPEPRKTPMLLTASADESNKKSAPPKKSKEKRKTLLVEHPNKKAAGKNVHSVRSISTNNSRPLSADDIQKAKMRAMFMQEKYGKVDTSKVSDKPQAMETQKTSGFVNSNVPPVPRSPLTSTAKIPVDPSASTSKQSAVPQPDKPETSGGLKLNISCQKNVKEKLDSKRVVWQIPPAVWIDPSWSVGTGENSKELEVQTQRNQREKETFYASQKDIPLNPKDPWDLEMDSDDSLTPEIPIDQPPDADTMEIDSMGAAPTNTAAPVEDKQIGSTSSTSVAVAAGANGAASEPDLELLTVLLKNPQLVFALTSNTGESVPSEQTVALLDTLKRTGLGLSELLSLANGAGVPKEPEPEPEPIPASLPSPTPPSDLTARADWRPEYPTQVKAPNLQQSHLSNRENTPIANTVQQSFSNVVSSLPSQPYASVSVLPAHIQTNAPSLPQLAVSVNPPIQNVPPMINHLNRVSVHQHAQQYALASDTVAVSIHQQPAVNKPTHGLQNISRPAVAHSSMLEPNASYATLPWESNAALVTNTGRNATADAWAPRTTNSYNIASANTVPYANKNAYGNQSTQSAYNAYGSTSVSSHALLPGHGLDRNGRNGYSRSAEYQTRARDSYHQHSRSPELGAGRDYGGTQSYTDDPQSLTHWNAGQESYVPEPSRQLTAYQSNTPAEPSRQWSYVRQSYTPAESSRHWSSAQQSYTPAEPSRQWSSEHQSYNLESSRPWSSGQQGQNPDTLRQWNQGKQDHYNPSDARRSSGQQWRR